MDRNTVIGMGLIGVLMMGMFYMNNKGSEAAELQQKHIQDSIAKVAASKIDSSAIKVAESIKLVKATGSFPISTAPEQLTVVENNVVKVSFTNEGGQPRVVELKKYKTYDGKPLIIQGDSARLAYEVNTGDRESIFTDKLSFPLVTKTLNADSSQTISFSINDSAGDEITHQYILRPNDYMIDFSIIIKGADKLLTDGMLNLQWYTQEGQVEKDINYERLQSTVSFVSDNKFDFDKLGNAGGDEKLDKPVDWLTAKQQFFLSSILSKNKFQSADFQWLVPADTSLHILYETRASCSLTVPASTSATIPLQLYYGPSDYNLLKGYNNQMENIVPYGSGALAFIKYINRYVLLPVFNFIASLVSNMGIVILLLTLFIRLLTSPILYKSYVSGAKMKALKPEVDKLKAKFGTDKQGFSMEQMKLWKSAGVSPLGGCLPAVLQIPIFMSLYYFFQANISLRGQGFLWAKDLASYDSIAKFSFSIPWYGDHVSLFTLTAVTTSLLISLYSMSNISMQDDSNPVLKYMPYIFPVVLLGVFNKLPAALTWYYTISNTITLLLQIVIQKYIIDHTKILAQIEENRKKPVKQSKLQERMQAMQEQNKKIQDMKNKPNRNI